MKNNKGFTLVELMVVVVIIGVLAAIATPNFMRMNGNAKEASVKNNCHLVQLASEDFSIQNDGTYAANLASTCLSGETIIDLLPWNTRLKNPFTQGVTEPVDGAASTVGESGYQGITDVNGNFVGYIVTGHGRLGVVCTYTNG